MSALISFAFQYNGWPKVRLVQHIDFFFISSFTNDNVLHTTSYDDGSSGITVRNCICDGSGVPWIMSAMNPCQLGGFSMKELDNNQNVIKDVIRTCIRLWWVAGFYKSLLELGYTWFFIHFYILPSHFPSQLSPQKSWFVSLLAVLKVYRT